MSYLTYRIRDKISSSIGKIIGDAGHYTRIGVKTVCSIGAPIFAVFSAGTFIAEKAFGVDFAQRGEANYLAHFTSAIVTGAVGLLAHKSKNIFKSISSTSKKLYDFNELLVYKDSSIEDTEKLGQVFTNEFDNKKSFDDSKINKISGYIMAFIPVAGLPYITYNKDQNHNIVKTCIAGAIGAVLSIPGLSLINNSRRLESYHKYFGLKGVLGSQKHNLQDSEYFSYKTRKKPKFKI